MQTTVTTNLANGVIGEFYDNSIRKVDTWVLNTIGVNPNIVGNAFTETSTQGVAQVGGEDSTFVGIAVNPKQYVNYNIGLEATNEIPNGVQAGLCKLGRIWVDVGGVATTDQGVYYDLNTGALGAGTAGVNQAQIPNCTVFYYPATSNGLCVIELLN